MRTWQCQQRGSAKQNHLWVKELLIKSGSTTLLSASFPVILQLIPLTSQIRKKLFWLLFFFHNLCANFGSYLHYSQMAFLWSLSFLILLFKSTAKITLLLQHDNLFHYIFCRRKTCMNFIRGDFWHGLTYSELKTLLKCASGCWVFPHLAWLSGVGPAEQYYLDWGMAQIPLLSVHIRNTV